MAMVFVFKAGLCNADLLSFSVSHLHFVLWKVPFRGIPGRCFPALAPVSNAEHPGVGVMFSQEGVRDVKGHQ